MNFQDWKSQVIEQNKIIEKEGIRRFADAVTEVKITKTKWERGEENNGNQNREETKN